MELVLEASHTHLYPGADGVVRGNISVEPPMTSQPCRVDFADGSVALAALDPAEGGICSLDVSPYVTAAGTSIPAKSWAVAFSQEKDGNVRFRIRKKPSQ